MAESNQESLKYAKMLALIRKRKQSSLTSLPSTYCPSTASFTLLNNTQSFAHQQPSAKMVRYTSARTIKSATLSTTTPLLNISRPTTSSMKKKGNTMLKKLNEINLLQMIRGERLTRLQQEKEKLLANIFNNNQMQIHRIDQDQHIASKENAINFKTYHCLNKLMDLQEKINSTTNIRPKTCYFKKTIK